MSERFRTLALSVARARNVPDFPMVVLPANIEAISDEELRSLAEESMQEIVAKLSSA